MRTRTGFPDRDEKGRWVRLIAKRNDGAYLRFPKAILEQLGWEIGDTLTLELLHGSGQILVTKLNVNDWGV